MKCLNRNVFIGLGVFALMMFFVAPSARGALPLLLLAACPLSMILMLFGMSKMRSSGGSCGTSQADPQREIDAKNAEIAQLEAMLLDSKQTTRNPSGYRDN